MLSMQIESLINAIVRQELRGKGREKEALHFHLDISISHYMDSEHYSERRGLHLLYHLNPSGTYISVFSAVTDSPFTKVDEVTNWKHECTHDSCWANTRAFADLYFDLAGRINDALFEDGLDKIAPKDMTEHNSFYLFGPAFDWVPVEVSKDSTDDRNYRRIVKVTK